MAALPGVRTGSAAIHWTAAFEFLVLSLEKQKHPMWGVLAIWCGQHDSNLHASALEPKSNVSANSTMPAAAYISLPRGGVHVKPLSHVKFLLDMTAIRR